MHSSDVGIITTFCWIFRAFLFPKLIDTLALYTYCCVITESIPVPCSAGVFINPMYKNRPGLGVLMRSLLTLVWHSWLCVKAGLSSGDDPSEQLPRHQSVTLRTTILELGLVEILLRDWNHKSSADCCCWTTSNMDIIGQPGSACQLALEQLALGQPIRSLQDMQRGSSCNAHLQILLAGQER